MLLHQYASMKQYGISLVAMIAAGIALLPVHIAQAGVVSGLLEQILPKLPLPGWPVYAVMASRMQPAAVRAFVDYVSARLAAL